MCEGGKSGVEMNGRGTVSFAPELSSGDSEQDGGDQWACEFCTFLNSASLSQCEMCQNPIPSSKLLSKTREEYQQEDSEPTWQSILTSQNSKFADPEEDVDLMVGQRKSPTTSKQTLPSSSPEESEADIKEEWKVAETLLEEASKCKQKGRSELIQVVRTEAQKGGNVQMDWVAISVLLADVEKVEHAPEEDPLTKLFLEDVFDKLIRKVLDMFESGMDNKRSWKQLRDKWKSLDSHLRTRHEQVQQQLLQQESEVDDDGGQDKQDEQASQQETLEGQEPGESEKETGPVESLMTDAFQSIIRSAVSIIMRQLKKNNPSKLDVLDALLDPKTQRYSHHTVQYTSKTSWSTKTVLLGAPHLHVVALEAFHSHDGLSVLTKLVKDSSVCSNPGIACAIASPVQKNAPHWSTTLGSQVLDDFIDAALLTIHIWPLGLISDSSDLYNKLYQTLHSILEASDVAKNVSSSSQVDLVSETNIQVAVKFLESDKLRFRRFGLEQLGKLSTILIGKRKIPRQVVTAYFKSLGVYSDLFGERLDERVVPLSEDLIKNAALDIEILDLMLENTNSRAVRKLLSSLYLFPVFDESLVIHLLQHTVKSVFNKADVGSYKLLLTTLAGENYLRQAVIRKGDDALLASLGALWSLLFASSVSVPQTASSPSTSARAHPPSLSSTMDLNQSLDDSTSPTVASALHITNDQAANLLQAFTQVAKEAKSYMRSDFASRCLEIIRGSVLSLAESAPRLGPGQEPQLLSPTDNSTIGFFAADDEESEETQATPDVGQVRAQIDVDEDEHIIHLDGLQVTSFTAQAVLTAYQVLKTLVLACPPDASLLTSRRSFIIDLDQKWDLKELILTESEQFLTNSQIRQRVDFLDDLFGETGSNEHQMHARDGVADDDEDQVLSSQWQHEIGSFTVNSLVLRSLSAQGGAKSSSMLRRFHTDEQTVDTEPVENPNEQARAEATEALQEHQTGRLLTLSTLLKGAKDKMYFTEQDVLRLWAACCMPSNEQNNRGNFVTQETFLLWLRVITFESRTTCVPKELSEFILLELFSSHLSLTHVGPKTYHCLQAHFVFVNNEQKRLVATDYEAVSEEFDFHSCSPPAGLEGAALVGRRVLVLFANGTMVRGKIKKYSSWSNIHQIEYVNGIVEEKELQHLSNWFLLPPLQASIAGSVQIENVETLDMFGLDTVWSVALENAKSHAQVSMQAFSLLLAVYEKVESGAHGKDCFVEEIYGALSALLTTFRSRSSAVPHEEAIFQLGRCFEMLRLYIADVETLAFSASDFVSRPELPLKTAAFGIGFPVELSFVSDNPLLNIDSVPVHTKTKIVDVFAWLARKASVDPAELKLHLAKGVGLESAGQDVEVSIPLATRLPNLIVEDLGISGIAPVVLYVSTTTTASSPSNAGGNTTSHELVVYQGPKNDVTPPPPPPPQSPPESPIQEESKTDLPQQEMEPLHQSLLTAPIGLSYLCEMDYLLSPAGLVSMSKEMGETLFNLFEFVNERQLVELAELVQSVPPFFHSISELLMNSQQTINWEDVFGISSSSSVSKWKVTYLAHLINALVIPYSDQDSPEATSGSEILSREKFIATHGPEAALFLFNHLCSRWFIDEPVVVDTAFPMLVGLMSSSVHILTSSGERSALLMNTAESLVQVILHSRDELEKRSLPGSPKGHWCTCKGELLGVTPRDVSLLSVVERSNTAPEVAKELLPLRPLVCAFCINTRRLVRSTLEALNALERIVLSVDSIGTCLFGSKAKTRFVFSRKEATCANLLVRKLLLNCNNKELRQQSRSFLSKVAMSDAEYRRSVVQALRQAEASLEQEEYSQTCEDFFALFRDFVPDNTDGVSDEDFVLVRRIMEMILEWPSKVRARGKRGTRRRPQTGRARFFNRYRNSETNLFVSFADTLTHMVDKHADLRAHVNSMSMSLLEGRSVVKVLWEDFLMDTKVEQPFCDSRESRRSIRGLLCALVKDDVGLSCELLFLMEMFSNSTPVPLKEEVRGRKNVQDWQFEPTPDGTSTSIFQGRNRTGHVGLRNRGSTCYQNSLLQLLFHIPRFRDAILAAPVAPPNDLVNSASNGSSSGSSSDANKVEEIKFVVGWMCICSGINDVDATHCHICFSPKSDQAEMVTESYHVDAGGASSQSGSSTSNSSLQNKEVLRQLQRTFRFMWESRKGCYDPISFVEACSVLKLTFPVTSQNDASEFFDKLLDNLEESLKGTPYLETMKDCFLGHQTRLKRCHTCGTVSVSREESFYRLELMTKDNSVEKTSLEECLASLVAPEVLTGDNKVDCEQCQNRTACTFVTCLTHLPDFLFIHPKRFTFDLVSMQTVKLNHYIKFPRKLDLFPYTKIGQAMEARQHATNTLSGGGESGSPSQNPPAAFQTARFDASSFWAKSQPLSDAQVQSFQDDCKYVLSGVLVHRGRAGGGHYYSFKKAESSWFRFDDARVLGFDIEQSLAEECFGGSFEKATSSTWGVKMETIEREWSAFMLLYERENAEPDSPASATPGT